MKKIQASTKAIQSQILGNTNSDNCNSISWSFSVAAFGTDVADTSFLSIMSLVSISTLEGLSGKKNKSLHARLTKEQACINILNHEQH